MEGGELLEAHHVKALLTAKAAPIQRDPLAPKKSEKNLLQLSQSGPNCFSMTEGSQTQGC